MMPFLHKKEQEDYCSSVNQHWPTTHFVNTTLPYIRRTAGSEKEKTTERKMFSHKITVENKLLLKCSHELLNAVSFQFGSAATLLNHFTNSANSNRAE